MELNNDNVQGLLRAWATEFLMDAPINWKDGQGFIEVSKLEEHIEELEDQDILDLIEYAENEGFIV